MSDAAKRLAAYCDVVEGSESPHFKPGGPFVEDLRSVLAELATLRQAAPEGGSSRASTSSPPNGDPEGWRLIESAPRDGTPFLGANFSVHRRDGGRPTRIWWQPEFAVGDETGWISGARVMVMAPGYTYGGKTEHMHSPERFAPTHWMPLPADGLLGATTDASSPNGRNLNPSSPPPPTGQSEG